MRRRQEVSLRKRDGPRGRSKSRTKKRNECDRERRNTSARGVKQKNQMWQSDWAKLKPHPKPSRRLMDAATNVSAVSLASGSKTLLASKQVRAKWFFCSRGASAVPRAACQENSFPPGVKGLTSCNGKHGSEMCPFWTTPSATEWIMDQHRKNFLKDLCLSVHLHDYRVKAPQKTRRESISILCVLACRWLTALSWD